MALGEVQNWSVGALNVKTAFLHAELNDEEDDIYLVMPPPQLIKLGFVKPGVYWKLKKVLYGLRSGPKRWGIKRDEELRKQKVLGPEGMVGPCIQGEACHNLWKVEVNGTVAARCLVYVDDIVVSGQIDWVIGVLSMVSNLWKCKVTGILTDEMDIAAKNNTGDFKAMTKLMFLGMTLEYLKGVLTMHQHQYILSKLHDRNRLHGFGRACLPPIHEGMLVPEEKDGEFENRKKEAHQELGTIQWLSLKYRPDISTVTSIAASCIAHNPKEALRMCDGIWRYLAATWEMRLYLKPMSAVRGSG